jgi:hypothetical protein
MANQINDQQLKDMAKKLKGEFPSWAALVASKISEQQDWQDWNKNPCTESNVRQIAAGNINSGMHRRLFILVGAQLMAEATKKAKRVQKLANLFL